MRGKLINEKKTIYENMRDDELLASIVSEKSAQELMKGYSNLKDILFHSCIEELERIPGIGKQRAQKIKLIAELSMRLYESSEKRLTHIRSAQDVFNVMKDIQHLQVEQFRVLYLNTKNKILSSNIITQGTLNSTVITPREVFCPAIKYMACSVILVHNHPSGCAEPSSQDREITDRIVEAGRAIAIEVLDHVVIGQGQFVSFKEKGWIKS